MSEFIASIDQGTTSTRFMVFDLAGRIVAHSQKEHTQIYPQPGWVEHDPLEIWKNTLAVFQEALSNSKIQKHDLAAIGITNQRETSVMWDKVTGRPFGNAIVWQDTRTADLCHRLSEKGGANRFRSRTGLPLATYFSGPKIMWMLEHHPEIRSAVKEGRALFGTMDSWLIWNLTGGIHGGIHATDVTNASRTLLMNLEKMQWDEEILETLAMPREILPSIQPSMSVFGQGAGEFKGITIAGDLGDQQAALVGQTCFEPGTAKNTYGTGCFLLMNTGNHIVPSQKGLLTTLGYQMEGQPAVYALEGSIAVTGALVQWLRDNLNLIHSSAEVESLARTVDNNGDVYFVPAFSGLFAPYWRADARGAILGMTRYTNKGHIARAALEATAYQTYEVFGAMETDSQIKLSTLKVDGGMVLNDLLMQFQADILNVPVIRPEVAETTALGAAYAAGLTIGKWKTVDELKNNWRKGKEWIPQMADRKRQRFLHQWRKAVERSLQWV
jgi:glycerol kinase